MIQFKENAQTDGQKDGWKDGQTLFHRTLPATARGPKQSESDLWGNIWAKLGPIL